MPTRVETPRWGAGTGAERNWSNLTNGATTKVCSLRPGSPIRNPCDLQGIGGVIDAYAGRLTRIVENLAVVICGLCRDDQPWAEGNSVATPSVLPGWKTGPMPGSRASAPVVPTHQSKTPTGRKRLSALLIPHLSTLSRAQPRVEVQQNPWRPPVRRSLTAGTRPVQTVDALSEIDVAA